MKKVIIATLSVLAVFLISILPVHASDFDVLQQEIKDSNLPPLSGVVTNPAPSGVIRSDQIAPTQSLSLESQQLSASATLTPVLARVTNSPAAQNEPTIAFYQPANVFVGAANDYRDGDSKCGIYLTKDVHNWSVQHAMLPIPSRFNAGGDPSVVVNNTNTAFVSCLAFHRTKGQSGIYVYKISNLSSFPSVTIASPVQVVSTYTNTILHDKPYIAIDKKTGKILVSWTKFEKGRADITIAQSTNAGASYSSPGVKVISDIANSSNQGSAPFYSSTGFQYVVWQNFNQNKILVDRSINGGGTWGVDQTVASIVPLPGNLPNTTFRTPTFPTAVADTVNTNKFYVAWPDYRNNKSDVMFTACTYTSNTALTCSTPIIASGSTTTDQFMPAMSISPNGAISIVYYSRVDTTSSKMVAKVAYSKDAGVSFTQTAVSPVIDQAEGWKDFIGDYIGITSTDSKLYPIFTGAALESGIYNQDIYMSDTTVTP